MPEIAFPALKQYISERSKTAFDPVYLVYGEEFLYHQAIQELVNAILPDPGARRHNYEVVDPKAQGDMVDIIDRMNTYSFLSEKKIMELRDSTIFISKQNQANLVDKIRRHVDEGAVEKASPLFLSLLGRLQLSLADLTESVLSDVFKTEEESPASLAWTEKLIAFCRENNLPVPAAGDDAERLKTAIERGFPKNNFLMISTDTVDKRKNLYKTIQHCGTIIDCSVAKGTRKVEQDEQRRLLREQAEMLLGKQRKKIASQAFDAMFQLIGFDLRTFAASLEKLIDYARDRDTIVAADVHEVLSQTRQDPVYELTGAISDRDVVKSLYLVSSLLSSGYHYLQVMTAITNQVRKLLLIRDFLESMGAGAWQAGMGFDRFRQQVVPLIGTYDDTTVRKAMETRMGCKGEAGRAKPGETESAVPKNATELIIVKNPNSAFPVYQQFLRSDKFSTHELLAAINILHQADMKLKTTGQPPARILEEVVLKICEKQE